MWFLVVRRWLQYGKETMWWSVRRIERKDRGGIGGDDVLRSLTFFTHHPGTRHSLNTHTPSTHVPPPHRLS
jgi:hypothetical protein